MKLVHRPYALPGNRITIGLMQYGIAAEIQDDEDAAIERLIRLMDGTRTIDEICAEFAETHPAVTEESVREVVDGLVAGGYIEDASAPLPDTLTPREATRYEPARNFFAWIDPTPRSSPYEIQSMIKDARVTLLGIGGTGSAAAAGLVSSGIGSLHVADFDRIEEPNLTRQLLYSEHDIGALKVDTGVARLRAMNSLVEVTGSDTKVTGPDDVAALMDGRDAFVLCADEPHPDIMAWTNQAALRTGTPWFIGFYAGPMAVVGSYIPGETGCWQCLATQEAEREFRAHGRPLAPERPNAVVAATANISGHLCALEVMYHLAGLPAQVRGRIFHWNYARWEHSYFIDFPRDPECPACGPAAR
ncbi:ThiF family adenylyltransferase [Sphaerisporangium album]|uniref:ThiF family adenylyltransferase n=1 Tax=Sphaerisporangium album TaxID=509200 RepID=A0A367F9Z9_9ACTN|nr:ThiF family adenylyltransferase [Sphaerisporangium album]